MSRGQVRLQPLERHFTSGMETYELSDFATKGVSRVFDFSVDSHQNIVERFPILLPNESLGGSLNSERVLDKRLVGPDTVVGERGIAQAKAVFCGVHPASVYTASMVFRPDIPYRGSMLFASNQRSRIKDRI